MISTSTWKVDTAATSLSEVISWCLSRGADRLLVAVRPGGSESANVRRLVRNLFGRHILDNFHASAWPGTELSKGRGNIFVIELDETVGELMTRAEPEINKWLHITRPPLPEDVCLFKSTESYPRFVSVTHEGLAWLVSDSRPEVDGVSKSGVSIREIYFDGRYFCKE